MGFYIELSCEEQGCGFRAKIGNATEFYVDANGAELPYGHPICLSSDGARRGIAGYWRDLLCWECGRCDVESIKLGTPIVDATLAWAMFPPPRLDNHPRLCPDCDGLLCDVGMLQMFLDYRSDPEATREEIKERLSRLKNEREHGSEKDPLDDILSEYAAELSEREGDPIERMEAELRDLAEVTTEEQLIIYRLGIAPRFPVTLESLAPLLAAFALARETAGILREDMYAKMEEKQDSVPHSAGSRGLAGRPVGEEPDEEAEHDSFGWFNSPAMKAKRAMDAQIEEIRKLTTHAWIATRMVKDQAGALDMFRKRCPKCKAESLGVQRYQT